jgi:putative phosphoribosyl transferase
MSVNLLFHDRIQAGQFLAQKVSAAVRDPNPLVLGLPRGGVPAAFEIAQTLAADLDIFLVRKIGIPGQEELAMGAMASGGTRVLDQSLLGHLGVSPSGYRDFSQTCDAEVRKLLDRASHQNVH